MRRSSVAALSQTDMPPNEGRIGVRTLFENNALGASPLQGIGPFLFRRPELAFRLVSRAEASGLRRRRFRRRPAYTLSEDFLLLLPLNLSSSLFFSAGCQRSSPGASCPTVIFYRVSGAFPARAHALKYGALAFSGSVAKSLPFSLTSRDSTGQKSESYAGSRHLSRHGER